MHRVLLGSAFLAMLGYSACTERSVSLPPEPYLYACSDGSRAYIFELQSPGRRVHAEPATWSGWTGNWRWPSPGAEPGRYLYLGDDAYLDILTLDRFSVPPLPEATYLVRQFHSPDRWYLFFKDDLYADWHAQLVNAQGGVVEDFGLVVGPSISPNFGWVFENRFFGTDDDPNNGIWVQRLRGGAPVHLVACDEATLAVPDTLWDLDGDHLLVISNAMPYELSIFRCAVRTDEVELVRRIDLDGPIDRGVLSPDFRRIAFTTLWGEVQDGLHALDIETGQVVRLHDGRDYHYLDWTRDGNYLVVEVDDGSPEGRGPKKLISFPDGKVYPLRGDYPCWPIRVNPAPFTLSDVGKEAAR